jgi:hypothetical protein
MPPLLDQLQSIARQAEQQAATRVNEILPHVRSGRLTPEAAVELLQQKGEQLASTVRASSPEVQRQAQQLVRAATNRAAEGAGQALRMANEQRQRVADTAIATMLDPVAAALPTASPSPPPHSPQASRSSWGAVAVGAGIGAVVAKATDKGLGTGAVIGGLIGLVVSLSTARR